MAIAKCNNCNAIFNTTSTFKNKLNQPSSEMSEIFFHCPECLIALEEKNISFKNEAGEPFKETEISVKEASEETIKAFDSIFEILDLFNQNIQAQFSNSNKINSNEVISNKFNKIIDDKNLNLFLNVFESFYIDTGNNFSQNHYFKRKFFFNILEEKTLNKLMDTGINDDILYLEISERESFNNADNIMNKLNLENEIVNGLNGMLKLFISSYHKTFKILSNSVGYSIFERKYDKIEEAGFKNIETDRYKKLKKLKNKTQSM